MLDKPDQLLFVYGSLKQGFPLHGIIEGREFVGTYKTGPEFKLINLCAFPAMVPANPGREITGEVYIVDNDTLHYLDVVEGVHRGLYSRLLVTVHDQLKDKIKAWAYIAVNKALLSGAEEITSGEWAG